MKKFLKYLFLLPAFSFSQMQDGYHEHDGFYLSMGVGPAFGPINLEASGANFNKVAFSGPGALVDFKIGGTINKTVTLSFDVVSRDIVGPDVETDGIKGTSSNKVSANDVTYGLGVTYYFMPINIFVNGTFGTGVFQYKDVDNNIDAKSKYGLALNLKVGKEWWVSKDWGLGLSGGFGLVGADDQSDVNNPSYSGKLSTGRFFLMFNTTYN